MNEFDTFATQGRMERKVQRAIRRQWLVAHWLVFVSAQIFFFVVWLNNANSHQWFWYPLAGWSIALLGHAYLALVARTEAELIVDLQEEGF